MQEKAVLKKVMGEMIPNIIVIKVNVNRFNSPLKNTPKTN